MIGEVLRQRRLDQAREAARALYLAGARRVWLFGSLARGDSTDSRTDLDLAVEGLDEQTRQRTGRMLAASLRCKVDVVSIEAAPPALKRSIERCRVLVSAHAPLLDPRPDRGSIQQPLAAGPRPIGLHRLRLQTVFDVLAASSARSVIDFGCGGGLLLEQLAASPQFQRIVGVDNSPDALALAARRLGCAETAASAGSRRLVLLCALATNPDPRFLGCDAAAAVEFIEHLDPPRLEAFRHVLFSFVRPEIAAITTPNAEYNVLLGARDRDARRHPDHRFEWTRRQFEDWIADAASRAGYEVCISAVGAPGGDVGSPTQIAVCVRRDART